jgi:hypothetical protein
MHKEYLLNRHGARFNRPPKIMQKTNKRKNTSASKNIALTGGHLGTLPSAERSLHSDVPIRYLDSQYAVLKAKRRACEEVTEVSILPLLCDYDYFF